LNVFPDVFFSLYLVILILCCTLEHHSIILTVVRAPVVHVQASKIFFICFSLLPCSVLVLMSSSMINGLLIVTDCIAACYLKQHSTCDSTKLQQQCFITFTRQELVTSCLELTTSTSGSLTATWRMQLMSKPYTESHPTYKHKHIHANEHQNHTDNEPTRLVKLDLSFCEKKLNRIT